MKKLYKYLPSKYIDGFVRRGEVLFRALSYFRDYDDAQVRSDEFEGTRRFRPKQGLEITMAETHEKRLLPHAFESTANEDDIFVFCLSTVLSAGLAEQFKASACVEIHHSVRFISEIRAALNRRPSIKDKKLVYGEVNYYAEDESPLVDWALPEKIAMSKSNFYTSQQEYRIAFAVNDAFKVENTRHHLVVPGERRVPRLASHPEHLIKLGSLSKLCNVHCFG